MGQGNSTNTKLWQQVFTDASEQTRKVADAIMKKATDQMEKNVTVDVSSMKKLVEEEAKKFDADNTAMLNKIYATYDTDKSDSLDSKEVRVLFKESLKGQKEYLPKQVDSLFDITKKSALDMAKRLGEEEDNLKDLAKVFDDSMKSVKQATLASLNKLVDECISNSEKLADELFKKLDDNGDGKISKDEFLKNYKKATQELVNIEQVANQFKNVGFRSQ
eukprot:TRINITY_DN187_c0_g1_i1.p1 TRINITY_DN187_c0_g1~~TRINITY_DN187_c0_g1_i1.p1  ORF type:complete len:219 (-),score=47.59 TRINITY_DN187_c0_g1_i1:279-935(-)